MTRGESALYVQIAWVMCDTYMHLLLSSAREFRREAGDNNGPRFLFVFCPECRLPHRQTVKVAYQLHGDALENVDKV